jgi:hypothetical protein
MEVHVYIVNYKICGPYSSEHSYYGLACDAV